MTVLTVKSETIRLKTKGRSDIVDITEKLAAVLKQSGVDCGIVTLFVLGSTAGLTTIEFEPGLVHDIKAALEKVAPENGHYQHHEKWGDDNGHSHVRASLIGPSLTIPFNHGTPCLGTWQQVILLDFDTRGRDREIICQILGN